MPLIDALSKEARNVRVPAKQGPLWTGPNGEGKNGGVTQGLLAKFLICRERFRLQVVEGLRPAEGFNHRTGYGNFWHACEEAHAGGKDWQVKLKVLAQKLCVQHQFQQQEILKWHNVCKVQFPMCLEFWKAHPDQTGKRSLLQEQVFDVPYTLPSGRTVRLRGKWDGVELMNGGLWLSEHKTKGDIDEAQIKRQLSFDLQVGFYLTALQETKDDDVRKVGLSKDAPISGVLYNVVRRPLSGGKGTIVQRQGTPSRPCTSCGGTGATKKQGKVCTPCQGRGATEGTPPEIDSEYYGRLSAYIKAEPETYFMKWQVGITVADLQRFRRECLDPILENLFDDWEWWQNCAVDGVPRGDGSKNGLGKDGWDSFDHEIREELFPRHCPRHFRMPFGINSQLLGGGETDLDACLQSGSMAGLRRADVLFPELEDEG